MQKRYELLRAVFVEGLSAKEAALRFGVSVLSVYSLIRDHKKDAPERFFLPLKRGPRTRRDKTLAAREEIVRLRKLNFSIEQIQEELLRQVVSLSLQTISEILDEEGFARLFRRTRKERLEASAARENPEISNVALFGKTATATTLFGGVFLMIPHLLKLGVPDLVESLPFYGSKMIPRMQYFLSCLALKLVGKERLCHVNDLSFDYGLGCFPGLNVLPKATAITQYSYRHSAEHTHRLVEGFVERLTAQDLLPGRFVNLDFHSIPHWGAESELDKNWVPTRRKAMKSVLAFFAQDLETTYLCFANADVKKDEQNDEILRFVAHYEKTTGRKPECLVFDSKLTTYANLNKLPSPIRFITLRRRGSAILERAEKIRDWKIVTLSGVERKYRRLKVHAETVSVKDYDGSLRQLIVKGTGRAQPMLLLTNDFDNAEKDLLTIYARRWRIENNIQENIDFFSLNALSSPVVVKVDFDVAMTLIANSLYKMLASKLRRFEKAKPKKIYRNFIEIPAKVTIETGKVSVAFSKKAYNPLIMEHIASVQSRPVPWFGDRKLEFAFD